MHCQRACGCTIEAASARSRRSRDAEQGIRKIRGTRPGIQKHRTKHSASGPGEFSAADKIVAQ
jgi:hypothetical protein